MGVAVIKKVIFLVDMNAFFISCETTRNPDLVGVPAAVAGDPNKRTGIILAANYEARYFGVKTAMVVHEALKLCPNIKLVPPDHRFYAHKSDELMNLLLNYTPLIEKGSIDEAWLDMTGSEGIFGEPLEAAQKLMNSIQNELNLPCSIGISENKFLSKMAADMKKPLGITDLWIKDIKSKLWPLPVGTMNGIGKQTAKTLKSFGIKTIGDLAGLDKDFLIKHFGKNGIAIHEKANGIDNSTVIPHSEDEMKSIGRSITLAEDLSDIDIANVVLLRLADDIGRTARYFSKKGSVVQITIKFSNFKTITRQITVPSTYLTKDIASAGIELLKQHWNTDIPVRLLGIRLSGFAHEVDQLSLFDENVKEEKLEKTVDAIRNKYGASKINWAVLMDEDE